MLDIKICLAIFLSELSERLRNNSNSTLWNSAVNRNKDSS